MGFGSADALRSSFDRFAHAGFWRSTTYIGVDRFSADAVLAVTGATAVGAALLSQIDTFSLPLSNQGSLKLRECTHHIQQESGHRIGVASESELLFHKLDPHFGW